ncbi:MAG: hypothetical protein WBE61_13240, partial [Nitrososphaeraceae archaeon]
MKVFLNNKTNPSDPACTSNPSPVDCTKKSEGPSCKSSPQPPVDCKAHSDDPSCKALPTKSSSQSCPIGTPTGQTTGAKK